MSTVIVPEVGRVVHYYRNELDAALSHQPPTHPLASIVTYVHSDRLVNLAVFDVNGNAHSRTSVTLLQPGDAPYPYARAEWMPYQKGQAKKTESLEAEVAKLKLL